MDEEIRTILVFRKGPEPDDEGYVSKWQVPVQSGMSVMNLLDDITRNIDPTLGYYTHSRCDRGVCARCAVRVNGTAGLACRMQIPPEGDIQIEPAGRSRTVRDIVAPKKKGARGKKTAASSDGGESTEGEDAAPSDREDMYRHLERLWEQTAHGYVALEKTPRHFGTDKLLHMGEIHTIDAVGRFPNINITELARELEVTKGAVSQMVKKLEKKGCLVAAKKPGNDKEVALNLTEEGRVAYEYHQHHHTGLEMVLRRMMERLDMGILEEIRESLEALRRDYNEFDADEN